MPEPMNISITGANGDIIHLVGEDAGDEGLRLLRGQLQGIYDAPVDTFWRSATLQRGATYTGASYKARPMKLGFRATAGGGMGLTEIVSRLKGAITYELDRWDPNADLARLAVEVDDYRQLRLQRDKEPETEDEGMIEHLQQARITFPVKVAQPLWEGTPWRSEFKTTGDDSGTITVHNPTDMEMFHTWVLTPGEWTIPDVQWLGPAGKRVPGGPNKNRSITLQPVTESMGGLVASPDPMAFRMETQDGRNVMGEIGGGYYLLYSIPPHTPKTELPISVKNTPSGGAKAELHQPRLWSCPWGGYA